MKTWMVSAVLAVLFLAGCQGGGTEIRSPGKGWMKQVRWGVFTHYLVGEGKFNEMVDSFDVKRFADQVESTGADYLIFTVGQNSGYYCSPNTTYENYVGCQPGQQCTKRDLPMEIAKEMQKHGIRFLLYLPSRSPQEDPQAMTGLADISERQTAPQEFIKRWDEVITEWSLRYGKLVCGWWFDGAYRESSWEDLTKPYNFRTWAAACRAGNPDSLLAFNNGAGIEQAFKILSPEEQDYTAGEQTRFGATPEFYPPYPNKQWHILSYLGNSWNNPSGPTYTDAWLIDYVKKVNRQGGIVSIDVNLSSDGVIYASHLAQLKALGRAIGKHKQF
jgi:hypothetical protein